MHLCEHPVGNDEDYLDVDDEGDPQCGRPAVDKLVWSDGSETHLCSLHIDEWIADIRENIDYPLSQSVRDEAKADLERNNLE